MTVPDSSPQLATEGTITLSDGRCLGYAEYGPADGDPLLLFHGTPGSRYTRISTISTLERFGIRQITLERPGFGKSTYDPDREILDWPTDVQEATEALDIDQFYVLGGSGGAPYVLACAARIPNRLAGVGVVAGAGPMDAPGATDGMALTRRLGFKLAPLPLVLWPFLWVMIQMIRIRPGHHDLQEGVRQGPKAPLHEHRLQVRPWGIDLTSISCHVHLWHGEQDKFAPVSMAEYMAEVIPSSTLYTYREEGHDFPEKHDAEILSMLCNQ